MADKNQLSLVIKAIDEITAPLRAVQSKIAAMTAPVRNLGSGFKSLGHEAGLEHLKEGVHKVGEGLKETVEHAKKLGETLLLGEVVGAAALFEITRRAVEAGSELKHAAERAGLTVDAYSQLRFAAGQAGVKQDEFASAMDRFAKGLGAAKARSGPLYSLLEKVSPTLAEQIVHTKGVSSGFDIMVKAFGKLHDPTKIAILQQAAFGKSSKEMGKFLGQGNEKIQEAMKEYLNLAGSQEVFADRSEEAEQALNKADAAFTGLRNAAAAELMPALSALAETVAKLFASHRADLAAWAQKAGKAITSWVEGGGIDRLVTGFEAMVKTVGDVIDRIGGFKTVAIAVGAVMAGPLLMSVVSLGASLVGLVPMIANVITALGSFVLGPVIAAIGSLVTALGAGYGAMEAFNLVLIANPIGATIAAVTALAGAAYLLYKNWEPVKAFFESLWESIKSPIQALTVAKEFYFGKSGQAAAPPATQAQTKVTVDFNNVPKGVRVTPDKAGSADLDLNMGFSSLVPG